MDCPACSIPNAPGATRCLTCHHVFGSDHTSTQATARTEDDAPPKTPTSRWRLTPRDSEEALAWLSCDPLPPIPLGGERSKVTIGRAVACDLVLPNNAISRAHAEITVVDGVLTFSDAGSFNGSHLNGKRVEGQVTIRAGDVLTLGPYSIEVRSKQTGPVETPEGTQPVARIEQGLLTQVPVTKLLETLANDSRTATLTVISGDLRGLFIASGGQPITATFGDKRDDEAVLAMLGLSEGRFVLTDRVSTMSITMSTPIPALLMEHARRQDEGSR